jgi:peptidyl-tRNA hydrolase
MMSIKRTTLHKKQYIVVRTDMSKIQQTVQAAHAGILAQYEQKYSDAYSRPLVILQVSNKFKLHLLSLYLRMQGYSVSQFYEPDMNSSLTAISFFVTIQETVTNGRKKITGNPVYFLPTLKQ